MGGEDLTEMWELAEAGAAAFTDDGLPVRSAGVMRQALQYQRLAGRVLALHEEDPALSRKGVMHEGDVSAALGLAGIPSLSESTIVQRDCALAAYEGGRIHVQHLSARQTVEAIEAAKAAGVQVSCEATPHHLSLTDEAARTLDTNYKMNPPLRSEDDRKALIEGLRSGAIDCVATDHAPHAREEKEEAFETAPMGVIGLETAFAALVTDLVLPGLLPLAVLIERMTAGLRPFGLLVPTLAVGSDANVCLADLAATWEVGEAGYESRSNNCAFAGRTLTGRVLMTVAGGSVAYRERSFAIGVAR
jgi:dihydroorotase